MGCYRTLWAELLCLHCNDKHLADVQFKTGDDFHLPFYRSDAVASDLPPGSSYEGCAPALCPTCAQAWVECQREIGFQELASALKSRQVSPKLRGDLLTQDLLAGLVEQAPHPKVTSGDFLPYSPFDRHKDFGLLLTNTDASLLETRVRDRLVAEGWPESPHLQDLDVDVDENHRLSVRPHDPERDD
jgi:hypothetical protein